MHLRLWKTKELFRYRDSATNTPRQIGIPHYPLYCGKTGLAHHECNSGAARSSLCWRNRFAFSCICCGSRFAFSCVRCLKPCNPNPDFSLWLSVFYHLVVSHATYIELVQSGSLVLVLHWLHVEPTWPLIYVYHEHGHDTEFWKLRTLWSYDMQNRVSSKNPHHVRRKNKWSKQNKQTLNTAINT